MPAFCQLGGPRLLFDAQGRSGQVSSRAHRELTHKAEDGFQFVAPGYAIPFAYPWFAPELKHEPAGLDNPLTGLNTG